MKKNWSIRIFGLTLAIGLVMILSPVASNAADLEYVKKQIEIYSQSPPFIAPGPSFNARECVAGKTIGTIPYSNAIPFIETLERSMEAVAKEVGVGFVEWKNQGERSQWVDGVNNLVNRKVNLIDLNGAPDPRFLQPQILQAKAAGILTYALHLAGITAEYPDYLDGFVPGPFEQSGRILADWVIYKTKGKANVVIVETREIPATKGMVEAILDEFKTYCPECKVKTINAPVTEWATKIQPSVQSEILANPELNYVMPLYDSMSQFVVPAIKLTEAQKRVKIATFNGTPFVLQMIKDGDVEMDVGENIDWLAYAAMDVYMRALCGLPPVKDPHIPLMIFDKSNVHLAGDPPQASMGYGTDHRAAYRKLWQLD